MPDKDQPRTAIVHDWLTGMRGGEKVLEVLFEIFPEADLYTLVHIRGSVSPIIEHRKIFTSFIHYLPDIEKKYRYYLPLMPMAIERFDLSGYDLVISSSHCVAKGVRVGKSTLHICYCHTPMRYIWDMYEQYFGNARIHVKMTMGLLRRPLQTWDVKSSGRVNCFIANSENVRGRIRRYYGRDATVIYPPVYTDLFSPKDQNPPAGSIKGSDHFLLVSAFAPYKKIDIAIEAFNRLGLGLKIIGTGQDEQRLRRIAGPTIEFLGWKSNEELAAAYAACKALIFPGEEDFGIVPVEAQAAGKPVIAYGKGGVTETVIPLQRIADGSGSALNPPPTGIFFHEQTPEALMEAVKMFLATEGEFDPHQIRKNAERFRKDIFKENFISFTKRSMQDFFKPGPDAQSIK